MVTQEIRLENGASFEDALPDRTLELLEEIVPGGIGGEDVVEGRYVHGRQEAAGG